jgi:hypothetical protein
MSKLLKVSLLLVLAVGLFGAYRYGAAQEKESPPTSDAQISPDVTIATKHVLQSTYNNNGVYSGGVISCDPSPCWTPIDNQLTVVCPGKTGTCTIQADMWITNGGVTTVRDLNKICLSVDGNFAPNCDLYLTGESPSDGTYGQNSSSEAVTGLSPGDHTVQTYFSTDGTNVSYYNSNYRVYKP